MSVATVKTTEFGTAGGKYYIVVVVLQHYFTVNWTDLCRMQHKYSQIYAFVTTIMY